jgi:hypothetical protein
MDLGLIVGVVGILVGLLSAYITFVASPTVVPALNELVSGRELR